MTKKVGEATIRGKQVSFFTPPHSETDFLWVDIEELARAFLPEKDVARMVSHARNFDPNGRAYSTARNGDRIATIVCHAMAQGFCGFIDYLNGHGRKNMEGPAYKDYCVASAKVEADHGSLTFEDIFKAFRNNGGPFMRRGREDPEGGVA